MISMLNFAVIRRFPSALATGLALTFSAPCLAVPSAPKQAESVNEAPAASEWRMSVKFVPKDQGWAPLHYERVKEIVFFQAKINGIDASVMLDNGAPTSIDVTFARTAGLTAVRELSKGKTPTAKITRNLLKGANIEVPHLLEISGPVQSAHFQALSKAIGHPVDAILGGDALSVLALTMFPGSQTLVLAPSGSVKVNGSVSTLPLVNGDQIDAQVDGKPVKLAIDLGSNDTVALSGEAWKRIVPASVVMQNESSTNAEGVLHTIQSSPVMNCKLGLPK
jgi:hypothetical protein